MADGQQIEGLPPSAIVRPIQNKIEGLPPDAVVRPIRSQEPNLVTGEGMEEAAHEQAAQSIQKARRNLQKAPAPSDAIDRANTALGYGKDFAIGAGKGALNTTIGIGKTIVPDWLVGQQRAQQSAQTRKALTTPQGTAQKIGFGGEQAAEFLIPGAGEEKAGALLAEHAPLLGKFAGPLGRLTAGALSTGTVNALQGGSFGQGAALGAGGGAIGEAGRAIAPSVAESALGITRRMRGFGKTPGEAALQEIKGVRPSTIEANATNKIASLTSQLEQGAANSTAQVSTSPAIQEIDKAMAKAKSQNSKPFFDQLTAIRDQLTKDFNTGQAIASDVPASQALNLKRGIGNLEKSWNPDQRGLARGVVRKVYGALDKEIDRAVPGSAEINQKISSLIPVSQRAASEGRGAQIAQRVAGRMAAHTGALIGGAYGGRLGYEEGGVPGAILGGTAGLVGPELLSSPASQMIGARILASPRTARLGRGLTATLLPKKSNE